ncbi:hypothetical protein N7532_004535 [Penicillium argentinense]|uniref:AMP-activated protein kinase glycogen-binding domain-containing protein n=1 Tax=Penicillium argentinense TaxID=1131581 RepID=A0A9W9FPI4_9EURO|nr:uncharacterized protein N7532_004535 [Penicillium argentinense]KAJ5104006.1 hypothetical protein N7532_004535 [Penicillium argentinense]
MGTFTFQWPYDANEVFVTGTFDDWGKTVKLDRAGDSFAKTVSVPTGKKIQYKFVVDGIWTTDNRVREENDGDDNINNVLLPEEIQDDTPAPTTNATMSGVTPDSTTAALAAGVPKEQTNGNLPGTFPETPGQESEQTLSVNPIPASGGYGNPIKLNPGEKVPDPSTINDNTVESTVKLDQESYEKGSSVPLGSAGTQSDTAGSSSFAVPPVTKNLIPESSLPTGGPAQRAAAADQEPQHAGGPSQQAAMADPGYTIQSAAPTSTTAALAADVPLEKNKKTNGTEPVEDIPERVKESIAEAHKDPEAAANKEAVEEKKNVEQELQNKVDVDESAGTPAPTATAATTATAPGQGLVVPVIDSSDVSPTSTPPPGLANPGPAPTSAPATENQTAPTVTTGPETTSTDPVSSAKPEQPSNGHSAPATKSSEGSGNTKDEKKKKRLSGFFSKLKEKLK